MYPHERSLVKHLAGKPFALIGVNSDDDVAIPQKLAETGEVTWRSFQNSANGQTISESWVEKGWPTIYLLDPEGKIRYVGHGKGLNENIAELMEEIGEEFPEEEIEATTAEERKREFGKKAKKKPADEPADEDMAEEEAEEEAEEDSEDGDSAEESDDDQS